MARLSLIFLSSWLLSGTAEAQNRPTPSWTWEQAATLSAQPGFILIDEAKQWLHLYVDGKLVGQSPVSTGRADYPTPLGDFTVLERDSDHRSNLYEDAPMPFMLRLTWSGVALHGGYVPGYPASHGCVRLPEIFAKKLYQRTKLGTAVSVVRGPFSEKQLNTDFLKIVEGDGVDMQGTQLAYRILPNAEGRGPVIVHVHLGTKRMEIIRQGHEVARGDIAVSGEVLGKYFLQYGSGPDGQNMWHNLAATENATGNAEAVIAIHPALRTVVSKLATAGAVLIVSGQDQPD